MFFRDRAEMWALHESKRLVARAVPMKARWRWTVFFSRAIRLRAVLWRLAEGKPD